MKIRRIIAIWTAKMISAMCRISGRQGVTLAGKAALKIDPLILEELAAQVREKIFVVCGTNGKTTTNNLLCAAIEAEGKKLVCNRTGSNMLQGVVAAFVLAAGNNGRLDADYACLEVDEASAQYIFPHLKPDYMILTNLFRDQLDRYGEIDITMELLDRAIKMVPKMTIITNGDDPLSAYLAMSVGNPYLMFGITNAAYGKATKESEKKDTGAAEEEKDRIDNDSVENERNSHEVRDGAFCKKCGARLEYDFYHYGQIGRYHCPNCSFERPEVDFDVINIDMSRGLAFDILSKYKAEPTKSETSLYEKVNTEKSKESGQETSDMRDTEPKNDTEEIRTQHISVNYRGFYNIYNILAAYSALSAAAMDRKLFADTLQKFRPQNGRMEIFWIKDCKVTLNLAKNPAGFNQNLQAVLTDSDEKDIIIAINDNAADGTDVSWLWDVDFDQLKAPDICSVTTCGIRCLDMQLRLKYVEIPAEAAADIREVIESKIRQGSRNLYVLVNYTALFSTRQLLAAMAQENQK